MPPPRASTRSRSLPFRRRPPSARRRPWSGRSTKPGTVPVRHPGRGWNGSPPGSTPGVWAASGSSCRSSSNPRASTNWPSSCRRPPARRGHCCPWSAFTWRPSRRERRSRRCNLLAHPDVPRQAQLSLLGPAALSARSPSPPSPRGCSPVLGPNRVGSPRTRNGHLPERFRLARLRPATATAG